MDQFRANSFTCCESWENSVKKWLVLCSINPAGPRVPAQQKHHLSRPQTREHPARRIRTHKNHRFRTVKDDVQRKSKNIQPLRHSRVHRSRSNNRRRVYPSCRLVQLRNNYFTQGSLIYDMLTGRPPFLNSNKQTMLKNLVTTPVPLPYYLSDDAKDLLNSLFKIKPEERLGYNGP